ncbi:hypothetical protein GGR19_002755 [Croceicoccus naphthovorans]|uniref:Uncharacterized protein n=1 Tax=Croceicoccus naphthovorans TaxID=1348774 RepID=A0A0G3XGW7_9SPHN|nr:hypothetical protein AB433_07505 [Croceicoccus naphthovorans]MBB3991318.1 hypothetical protein [Croceicoccus naphthovorans]
MSNQLNPLSSFPIIVVPAGTEFTDPMTGETAVVADGNMVPNGRAFHCTQRDLDDLKASLSDAVPLTQSTTLGQTV